MPTSTSSPSRNNKQPVVKVGGGDCCPVCKSQTCQCGDNCRCTEEFCCSQATSLLQSLAKPGKSDGGVSSPSTTPRRQAPSLLSHNNNNNNNNNDPLATSFDSNYGNGNDNDEDYYYSPLATVHNKVADLAISGMTCTSCAQTITHAVQAVPGVQRVAVAVTTDSAVVEYHEPPADARQIEDAVTSVGFSVTSLLERVPQPKSFNNNNDKQPTTVATTDLQKANLAIGGMTCSMCSQAISRSVQALGDGIESVQVILSTDSALVQYHPAQISLDAIQQVIEDIGYQVESVQMVGSQNNTSRQDQDLPNNNNNAPFETVEERWQRLAARQEQKVKERRRAFLSSLAGAFPILLLSMVLPHFVPSWSSFENKEINIANHTFPLEGLIFWLLATPMQFFSGWDFYRKTFFNLRVGTAGMDVLVSLGTTASYGYACWGLWKDDHETTHFFETAATLICFILAGKWMQALAVRRTSKALTELMKLQSSTAVRVTPLEKKENEPHFNPIVEAYREETVAIADVQKGDMVKVIRGSSVPADGRIAYGEMSVDESMVTGESMPVLKTPGSDVLGGTICVETSFEGSGAVFIEVTGVGSDTALSQIIELVQDAQTRSVPIQSFADTVSAIFVPTVCAVSLLTYMTWYALCSARVVPSSWYENLHEGPATFSLTFAIACLVISCPCALGLATPTAVMVGAGKGARLGVLMKGGEALEVASKVDSVVFDKTGTLTKGQPVIVDYHQFDPSIDRETLLWMLGCLEQNSEHPLAQAIVVYAQEQLGNEFLEDKPFVQPKSFKALTGRGASGILSDCTVAVGNRPFASESGIEIPNEVEHYMQSLEREGKTAVLVSVDGNVCLAMGISDRLKADAPASVAFLRDIMKIDVWMVTGDNRATAQAIGRQLGLPDDRIISEALPAAKVQQVRRLQAQDHIVVMIGDGINDSPALAQADVGISLGSGAKIATEASDMVLVRGNVADVCTALHLSRSIFRRIQLNLLFSLLYNCLGIPIAAGVFYPLVQKRLPPMVAGAAMALSSVSVVLSSLSLRLYRPPPVTRRRSSVAAWAREMERQGRDEIQENLLLNDHLASSEFTESTPVADNRTYAGTAENV